MSEVTFDHWVVTAKPVLHFIGTVISRFEPLLLMPRTKPRKSIGPTPDWHLEFVP